MQRSLLIVPLIIIFSVLSLEIHAENLPPIKVADHMGVTKDLGTLLQSKSLLVMGYYNCKHMCNYLVKDLTKKLETFKTYPNVIYFGIDENEGSRDALFMKKRIFGPFQRKWSFLVADKTNIALLTNALHFEMQRDPVSGVINHELGIYAADKGQIIRKIPDFNFTEQDLTSTISDNLMTSIKKFCSDFDPRRSKYGKQVMMLLSFSSAIFLMVSFIGFLKLQRSRR